MDQDAANKMLRQYRYVIRSTALRVTRTFEPSLEFDDVLQDARVLFLSYAGFIPDGRLPGKLHEWEQLSDGNRKRTQKLVTAQLRKDLNQHYGRELDKRLWTEPLEVTSPNKLPQENSFENAVISNLTDHGALRVDFPYLARKFLDGRTEEQMAKDDGISIRTVRRRVDAEKSAITALGRDQVERIIA